MIKNFFFLFFIVTFLNCSNAANKVSLKTFLNDHKVPLYQSIPKNHLITLENLLNTAIRALKQTPTYNKNLHYNNLFCFFSIQLFYATNRRDYFTLANYTKIKGSHTVKEKIFDCILSDLIIAEDSYIKYELNKNAIYTDTIFNNQVSYYKERPLISKQKFAKSVKTTTTKLQQNASEKEIIIANIKNFTNNKYASDIIDGVVQGDKKKIGGALLFFGLREGLTKEQRQAIAEKMTELVTQINMKPVQEAVKAYMESNVRVYINNANKFLVNYKLEF